MAKNKGKPTVSPKVEQPKIEEDIFADAVVDGVEMSLNIRKDPEIKDNKIAVLKKGTKLIVVNPDKPIKNKFGEWLKVRLLDKDEKDSTANGYAMKKYIKVI